MKKTKYLFAIVVFCSLQGCGFYIPFSSSRSFTLAIWNIGNFSNGAKAHSTIDITQNPNIGREYYDFINKTINPDVMVLNEYDDVFFKDRNGKEIYADSILFNNFRYRFIGPRWWKCNAIFSKYKIDNLDNDKEIVRYFTSHKAIKDDIKVSKRKTYYLETTMEVRGSRIKIVVVHIDHSQTISGIYQQAQIAELVEKYKNEKQVIICGDFNTHNLSKFKDSGFHVANNGSFKTYPLKGHAIDNIVYKGVIVSKVHMLSTNLSDHNPLMCTITLPWFIL